MPVTRLLILALLLTLPAAASASDKCPQEGKKAPPFAVLMSDGSPGISLRSALEKKVPVVVSFWQFDCKPCKEELPLLQKISDELGEQVTVMLMHVGPDERRMKDKLQELNVRLASASDDTARKQDRYCVNEIPTTFVIDAQGIVRARLSGTEGYETKLREALARLGVR